MLAPFALAVGPLIGTFIRDTFGFQASFLFTAVLTGAGTLLAIAFKSPKGAAAHKRGSASAEEGAIVVRVLKEMIYPPVVPLAAITVAAMMCHGTLSALIYTIEDMGYLENASLFFIGYAVFSLLTRPLSGRLFDQYGLIRVGLPSLAITAAGMAILIFFHSSVAVFLCGAILGVFSSASMCALQAESVRNVPAELLGRATNTFFFGPDIAVGFGPAISGIVLQEFGCEAMFAFNVAIIMLGFFGLLLMFFRQRNARPKSAMLK